MCLIIYIWAIQVYWTNVNSSAEAGWVVIFEEVFEIKMLLSQQINNVILDSTSLKGKVKFPRKSLLLLIVILLKRLMQACLDYLNENYFGLTA